MFRLKPLIVFGACAAYIACAETTGPVASEEHAGLQDPPIHFLYQASTAPPLETYEASFRACRNEAQKLRIRYRGADDLGRFRRKPGKGSEYLSLKVPKNALLRWPDGRPFADRECVWITVTADPSRLLAEFHPAGLVFDPKHPARLRMHYSTADPDLNGDGVVDRRDEDIAENEVGIWRLPHGDEQWDRIEAKHDQNGKRFDAKLESFSHYAIAH